jgi:hypothetical protein
MVTGFMLTRECVGTKGVLAVPLVYRVAAAESTIFLIASPLQA